MFMYWCIWWTFVARHPTYRNVFFCNPVLGFPFAVFLALVCNVKMLHHSGMSTCVYFLPCTLTHCISHECYWSSISYWNCHANWTLICVGSISKIWWWQLWHSTFHCSVYLSCSFTQLRIQPAEWQKAAHDTSCGLFIPCWGLMME